MWSCVFWVQETKYFYAVWPLRLSQTQIHTLTHTLFPWHGHKHTHSDNSVDAKTYLWPYKLSSLPSSQCLTSNSAAYKQQLERGRMKKRPQPPHSSIDPRLWAPTVQTTQTALTVLTVQTALTALTALTVLTAVTALTVQKKHGHSAWLCQLFVNSTLKLLL